jgi:predicted RNA-binding Zn ribbon-like protein
LKPAPPSLSFATIRDFSFIAGDPALDLVNTAAWSSAGPRNDRLGDYERLLRWATEARLIDARAESGFGAAAARDPHAAAHAVEEARSLRYLIRRLMLAATGLAKAGRPGRDAEEAVAEFDQYLREARTHLRARLRNPDRPAEGLAHYWPWEIDRASALQDPDSAGEEITPAAILWPVARAASALLTSAEVASIRMCGGDDCGWMFVDRSRNRRRRWCEMQTCGTRAKEARRSPRTRS